MIKEILSKHVDDQKAIPVTTYIEMRKKHFPHLNEDLGFLNDYETMIVLALSFPATQAKKLGKDYGYISRYAHGKDYHLVFEEKLDGMVAALAKKGVSARGSSDKSIIDERFAAYLAGLGFLGHNRFLIHPTYGTHLYLATLLVDVPFETNPHLEDSCGSCTKCIDACPTDALAKGVFYRHRCLSHLSQDKKPIELNHLKKMNYVYGCDICLDVCPKNQGIKPVDREIFQSDAASQLHLESILKQSNKTLMKAYKDYAFSWRGMTVIKRNAMALLMNRNRQELLPLMETTKKTYEQVPWFAQTAEEIIAEMRKKT